MSTARPFPLDARDAGWEDEAPPPAEAPRRPGIHPIVRLTAGDVVAGGLCALYGLALLAFHRSLHDVSLRVHDFLHHAELARGIAEGRPEVHGFYPLGYPALLALGFRRVPDIFVVGKVISGAAALVALFATYRLLRALLVNAGHSFLPFVALGMVGASPAFLQHATTPGTDMLHVALLLASLWLVIEAVDADEPARWLIAAGLLGGLSYLVRYTSTLVLPALGLWLLLARPWGRATLRLGGGYVLAFVVAAMPQFVLSTLQQGAPFYNTTLAKNVWVGTYAGPLPELRWGQIADSVSLLHVIRLDPGRFLLNWGTNSVGATVWGDVLTIAAWCDRLVGGGGLAPTGPDGLAGLAPALLKVLAVLGAAATLLRGAQWTPDLGLKAGFLALFTLLFTATTALAFITPRLLLIAIPLLVVLALAALHHLATRRAATIAGVLALAALAYHLAAFGYPDRWMLGYTHAAEASALVRAQGAAAGAVYTTSWAFYDHASPWLEHYQPLPIDTPSVDAVVATMRARGVRYLVFDRNHGLAQWPQLEPLLHPERQPGGLRLVGAPILSREHPPNLVLVYALP
ncbi:MAG: glycosyltransferase family 39 protein [Chloroflexota bacterium]|nr:glycosyltransferase family 39 protein [Chloroflexota bacterium]